MIIAKNLTDIQEKRLVRMLCDYKTIIGWTLTDIKGISHSICMHRHLNFSMIEVVNAEILKLLYSRVICPILNGKWVTPIHIVPKKSKIYIFLFLPCLVSVREVCSFIRHASFYQRFIKNFSKITLTLCKFLVKDVNFMFGDAYKYALNELKKIITLTPIM
jgi:hypothetical protein